MGIARMPGLIKRGGIWHIDKQVGEHGRLCESTGCSSLKEANSYLTDRLVEIKREIRTGRPLTNWRKVATKYLVDYKDQASIRAAAYHLQQLDPYIGDLLLHQVHDETLKPFVLSARKAGRSTKTINLGLAIVRRILNLCANSWRSKTSGLTWLESAPKITMQNPPHGRSDSRKPYPLDWAEQRRLFQLLPKHLVQMALFKVNTGCRETEVCGLKWEWECQVHIPELKDRIFLIPGDVILVAGTSIKNRQDRIIVLNDIAQSVVENRRGENEDFVFTFHNRPMLRMHNSAWKRAWRKAGLPVSGVYSKGVHNLKHTIGGRLRAAGVHKETRKVILGHKDRDITTHYSAPEIVEILNAVQKLCDIESRKTPALNIVKLRAVM